LAGRGGANNPVRTTPPVRALAKTLGVDLESLAAEVEGVITRVDVESAAGTAEQPEKSLSAPASRPASSNSTPALGPRETRIPIKGVRKVTAEAVTRSAFTAPHVTEWLAVDVTATMDAVARLKKDSAWADVRINPLLFVARAFLLAIRSFPDINATWDDDAQEIVIKNYVNLGIAAATPRGLIVPNIKDADQLDLRGLAQALDSLVATARAGKSTPTDMSGGTITITNIGALGVDAGTPILNPGESAILAFGAVRLMPWVHADQLCVRQVTQLAMSFDHRLVDGQLGSNVLARVGSLLNDPGATFLHA
jgi:2-oxoisovalerate dehydrogenase E2 component (dihydrolipoyl transacylase)